MSRPPDVPFPSVIANTEGSGVYRPVSLLGHGNLTVNLTALAHDANSTALLHVIDTYDLPGTFTISKHVDLACDGRVDFDNITQAVAGDLCLGADNGYNDAVDAFQASANSAMMVAPSEDDTCGCFCSCSVACMVLLLLAPLCCKHLQIRNILPLTRSPLTDHLQSRGRLCCLSSRLRLKQETLGTHGC